MELHPDLTRKLYSAFPHLYRGRFKSQYESAMCWGFTCGDGWYQVIYDLSQEFSDYLAEHPELDFEIVQVKSKLGTFRFHISYRDVATERMIERARVRASFINEVTGATVNPLG